MDIRSNINMNAAILNDTRAAANGSKNLEATAQSVASAESAPSMTSIQEETSSIKNTNDVFGYLKKSEKALVQISALVGGTDDLASVRVKVSEILETTTYKEKNIFSAFRQDRGGSTTDLKSDLEGLLSQNDLEGFKATLSKQSEVTAGLLGEVKKELLGSSQSLDRRISTDIDTIKRDIESMAPLGDVNSPDHLKSKLKALLG